MMPDRRVTVVIPAYRCEATIRLAVDSVLAQQGCETKAIVVVDGDLDGTATIVRSYGGDRVKLLVNEGQMGGQFSRNRGLDAVDTLWVMFLDGDDYLQGPLLQRLMDEMDTARADIGFGPWRRFYEDSGAFGKIMLPEYTSNEDVFVRWVAHRRFVPPCAVLWRTDFVRQIGGWDPELNRNQDGELAMRAILGGARFAQTDQGCGIWVKYKAATSITSRTDNLAAALDAPVKMLAVPTSIVEEKLRRRTIAEHYYNIAMLCFDRNRDDIALQALRRSRALGFRANKGWKWTRRTADLVGLPLAIRLRRLIRAGRNLSGW